MMAEASCDRALFLLSPRHVGGGDVGMVVLVFGEDLFSMDGDGLLGTPVDTGQAMAAMGPDDGSFGRTDDIAHGADAGTEAAGNAAVPVDGRRQQRSPARRTRPRFMSQADADERMASVSRICLRILSAAAAISSSAWSRRFVS